MDIRFDELLAFVFNNVLDAIDKDVDVSIVHLCPFIGDGIFGIGLVRLEIPDIIRLPVSSLS